MKPTLATRLRCGSGITTTEGCIPALILAAMLLEGAAVPARADCNPADRIDAQCYPDLQAATAAAIAANQPLWLPAGTYTLDRELVIDYAPLAATGFQIISDGAVIDATATGQRAMSIECSGGTPDNPKGCFISISKAPCSSMPIPRQPPCVLASTTSPTRTTLRKSIT